jgi:Fur family transcriptional regulator, ferric uptake regulator
LTVDEILQFGRERVPRLGMTTVYRSIREMLREGLLLGIQYPGQPIRYELPAPSDHIHFICHHCKKVYDLPLTQTDLSMQLPDGFRAEGQELIIYGTCAGCRAPESADAGAVPG